MFDQIPFSNQKVGLAYERRNSYGDRNEAAMIEHMSIEIMRVIRVFLTIRNKVWQNPP